MSFGRLIALLSFILPVGVIGVTYWVAIEQGTAPACNPFLQGCTDITHTGMKGDAGFIFRGGLVAACSFLMVWWMVMQTWMSRHVNTALLLLQTLLGVVGAIGLIVATAVLLPEKAQSPFSLHVKGANLFFQATVLAILLNYFLLFRARGKGLFVPSLRIKTLVLIALIAMAISVEGAAIAIEMRHKSRIIEWWGTLFVALYFLSAFWDWKRVRLVHEARELS
ncbi:MAG: hypothetical protein WAO12_06185 [Venatoribacter sp.]